MEKPIEELDPISEEDFKAAFWAQVEKDDVITYSGYKLTINRVLGKLWESLNKT